MISTVTIARRISTVSAAVVAAFLPTACDIDGGDNLPRVPDQGLFILADVNRHEGDDSAQVAAAVFNDGEPVNLVGGDLFEARTATERVLLKQGGPVTGSYAASLPVDDGVDVFLDVVHLPVEAREDRWYPIDLLNTDPGPGELVGKSAMVSFPSAVTIAPLSQTVYTSISDTIDISWNPDPVNAGDLMRVLASVECYDGLATSSYGVVVDNEVQLDMDLDDGSEAISLNKFIYDLDAGSDTLKFISDAALVLLQELLNQLSAGNIDPDFLLKQREANPIESTCEIRLFLQRQRPGQFDVTFDGGRVTGSSSAEVNVIYQPPVPFN